MTSSALRGRTKSGRCWKKSQQGRFSSIHYKVSRTLSTTWDEKLEQREKKQELQRLQSDIKARQDQLKEEKKRLREEKQKRRQENELKSMSFQSVSRAIILSCFDWSLCVAFCSAVKDASDKVDEQEATAEYSEIGC